MTERPIRSWIFVNDYMHDDYRRTVVNLALQHLPHAEKSLQRFAIGIFSAQIRIPGFRSFGRAPVEVAERYVSQAMEESNDVAIAVICLWANKEQKHVATLAEIVKEQGWQIRADWSWEEARMGFSELDDFPLGHLLFDKISEEYQGLEKEHLLLATLWASRALVQQSEIQVVLDEEPIPAALETLADSPQTGASTKPTMATECATLDTGVEDTSVEIIFGKTLDELIADLQRVFDQIQKAQSTAVKEAQLLLTSLEQANFKDGQAHLNAITQWITALQENKQLLSEIGQKVSLKARQELSTRPDLDPDLVQQERLIAIENVQEITEKELDEILAITDIILAYDKQKKENLAALDAIQSEIVQLQVDLTIWTENEMLDETDFAEPDDLLELPLKAALEQLHRVRMQRESLEKQLTQLWEASINRITALVENLRKSKALSEETAVTEKWHLAELDLQILSTLPHQELYNLEQSLNESINQQMIKDRDRNVAIIATELSDNWQKDRFPVLLMALAQEQRDVETVLLLLSSISAYPPAEKIILHPKVVDSFLRGLEVFSEGTGPSKMLNLGVSTLLKGWEPQDNISRTKLCFHLLAAKYAGDYRLPSDFLWNVSTEWPLGGMPGWGTIWKHALLEQDIPTITSKEQDEQMLNLEQAREQISRMFAREGGGIIRLRSIKSHRHRTLIAREILPSIENILQKIQVLDKRMFENSEHYEMARCLAELERIEEDARETLDEESLEEQYKRTARKTALRDQNPFHRRTTLRVLAEYAHSLA